VTTSPRFNAGFETLRKAIVPIAEDYASDEYEGIAFHSSSIILHASKAGADIFGYTADEMVGMNAWLLFKPESANALMKHLVEKSEVPYRVKGLRKDRAEINVELKGKDFEILGEPVRAVLVRRV